ncbi:hypothetical protein BDR03DRAFT_609737 [Suillus americanus]|nr:hypothetical protein BDR03DRAFT_609737 [Suillus americanus]
MAEDQFGIESAPTPSIESSKSRFEQLAQDNTTKPLKSNPTTSPRQQQQQRRDDSHVQHHELRNALPNSESSKRAPPPPPPSRSAKKPIMSPAVSPLLRPVPVPAALRSPAPRASLEHPSVSGQDDDDSPRGSGVASLRERFAHFSSPNSNKTRETAFPFTHSKRIQRPRLHSPTPLFSASIKSGRYSF